MGEFQQRRPDAGRWDFGLPERACRHGIFICAGGVACGKMVVPRISGVFCDDPDRLGSSGLALRGGWIFRRADDLGVVVGFRKNGCRTKS